MKKIKVILICGRKGSGKTTIAKYIEGSGYLRMRFANRLKKMLVDGLGIDPEYVDGSKKEEPCPELCGRTARHAMMTLGTEWGREMIHPDIWVNALLRGIKECVEVGVTKFVIDDLRFLSEEAWARVTLSEIADVKIIKVLRDGLEKSDHQSEKETDLIKADLMILNYGSYDTLYKALHLMLSQEEK